MQNNRRQFIITLAGTTCAAGLAANGAVVPPAKSALERRLEKILSSYGTVTDLHPKQDQWTASVHITSIRDLPTACASLSRLGTVRATGNELSLTAGSTHILITNRV